MVLNKYFYGTRIAKKGGLKITETSSDFPKELAREVERRCLELTAPDMETMPISVYPWKEQYLVIYAKKVPGDGDDPRPHEQIWGILLEANEFRSLNSDLFTETFAVSVREQKGGAYTLPDTLEELSEESTSEEWRVALFYMLLDIIEKRQKFQITGANYRNLQAMVYSLLPDEFSSCLYTISNGECPQSQADILFTENLYYQKKQNYKKLDLEKKLKAAPVKNQYVYFNQLIAIPGQRRNEAYGMFKTILPDTKETGPIDSRLKIYNCLAAVYLFWKKDKKVQKLEWSKVRHELENLVSYCPQLKSRIIRMYPFTAAMLEPEEKKEALNPKTSELFFTLDQYLDREDKSREVTNRIRLTYAAAGIHAWQECQSSLRLYLEEKRQILVKKCEKFGQLLILAFQSYQEICFGKKSGLCFVPCNFQGMLLFLNRLELTKAEKEAVIEGIWKIHNEIFELCGIERQLEKNLKSILTTKMEEK